MSPPTERFRTTSCFLVLNFFAISFTQLRNQFRDEYVTADHDQEENEGNRGSITNFPTVALIFFEVVSQSVCNVVNGRVAGEGGYDTTETEGTGDSHDSTEHQLGLHDRQGDVPEFLPSVLDTVNGSCFVKALIDSLKTCDKGKECSTEGGPECNDDTQRHDEVCILEELDRGGDEAELHQPTVDPTVGVTGEQGCPNGINLTGDGRCVEDQCYDSSEEAR